jgi:uncharacterized small protein (DUF1192 family)
VIEEEESVVEDTQQTSSGFSVLKIEEESEEEEEVSEPSVVQSSKPEESNNVEETTFDVSDKVESKPQEVTISKAEQEEIELISVLKEEVDRLKSRASEEHKKGMFEASIKLYEEALRIISVSEIKVSI